MKVGPFLNDIAFAPSANVTLNLDNAQGYPEIVVLPAAQGEFNTPISNQTALSSLMTFIMVTIIGSVATYGSWNAVGTYIYSVVPVGYTSGPFTDAPQQTIMHNNILNFLLKRDLNPASNDNDPMWSEKAA